MIAEGTRIFLKERRIDVTEIGLGQALSWGTWRLQLQARTKNPIMIFGGGGAFLDVYKRKDQIESLFGKFYRSLIMPSTFAVSLDTSLADREVIIYRRDTKARILPKKSFLPRHGF